MDDVEAPRLRKLSEKVNKVTLGAKITPDFSDDVYNENCDVEEADQNVHPDRVDVNFLDEFEDFDQGLEDDEFGTIFD